MRGRSVPRVVVVGTGTGVGKTYVTHALGRALRQRGSAVLALKPVETGEPFPDARLYDVENPIQVQPHPLYAFSPAISPHLAARQVGRALSLDAVTTWCSAQEHRLMTQSVNPICLIETAGGALTPLSPTARNFELLTALEPECVVLVASDALGALNAVATTMTALRALGREPDLVVLSGSAAPDETTGTNASELVALGIARHVHRLVPGGDGDELASMVLGRVCVP